MNGSACISKRNLTWTGWFYWTSFFLTNRMECNLADICLFNIASTSKSVKELMMKEVRKRFKWFKWRITFACGTNLVNFSVPKLDISSGLYHLYYKPGENVKYVEKSSIQSPAINILNSIVNSIFEWITKLWATKGIFNIHSNYHNFALYQVWDNHVITFNNPESISPT